VLVLVGRWDRPWPADCPSSEHRGNCSSALCLLQGALALGDGTCDLLFISTPSEEGRLRSVLATPSGGQTLSTVWRHLQQHRDRTSPEDPHSPKRVHCLHRWLAAAAAGQLRGLLADGTVMGERAASLCDQIGWMLRQTCAFDEAASLLRDGLRLSLEAADAKPQILREASDQLGSDGFTDWILEHFENLISPSMATFLLEAGNHRIDTGDLQGGLGVLNRARLIRTATGTLASPAGAALFDRIGLAFEELGDGDGARRSREHAQLAREAQLHALNMTIAGTC